MYQATLVLHRLTRWSHPSKATAESVTVSSSIQFKDINTFSHSLHGIAIVIAAPPAPALSKR